MMPAAAARRWSLNELRALETAAPLIETLRARATRRVAGLQLYRDSAPRGLLLPAVAQRLEGTYALFKAGTPHQAVRALEKGLQGAVEALRDAPDAERLGDAAQSVLRSGYADLISARLLLCRIDQLDGPPPRVLPSSTDGWNPTDVPAAAAAAAAAAQGVFGETPPLSELLFDAVDDARAFCREKFGDVADVKVVAPPAGAGGGAPSDGPVVLPSYVKFVLHELLKNSLAAHVYAVGVERLDELPEIELSYRVSRGWGHVYLRDHGGGWPAGAEVAAHFLYTTRPGRARGNEEASWQYSRAHGSQFEGLGAGLPLASLHARYLGGGVALGGIPGQGVHAVFSFDTSGDQTDAAEEELAI